MAEKLHFLIIDDDKLIAQIHAELLELEGHKVTILTSSLEAVQVITKIQPDCVICDTMMPELDGLELFKRLRGTPNIKQPVFITLTGKVFEFDRRKALELGIDGYLTKPVNQDTFVDDLLEIINKSMVIEFWGVRGTLPVPGKKTNIYGGNTNCVSLCFAKKLFFIFDAGSGIKELSNHIIARKDKFSFSAKIFITHPHYDHINGLPFFVPLYMKGNEFEIIGTHQGDVSVETFITNQMDSIYFPITMDDFASKISFRNVNEEVFNIDELQVSTLLLNHPGRCLGYRVQYENKSFCYITDNELYLEDSSSFNQFEVDRLINFIKDTDVLVMDSTYTDEEYVKKTGWGHSGISRVVDVADKAKAKLLCLYHHDPDQFDVDIEKKLEFARALLTKRNSTTRCIAAAEGEKILI